MHGERDWRFSGKSGCRSHRGSYLYVLSHGVQEGRKCGNVVLPGAPAYGYRVMTEQSLGSRHRYPMIHATRREIASTGRSMQDFDPFSLTTLSAFPNCMEGRSLSSSVSITVTRSASISQRSFWKSQRPGTPKETCSCICDYDQNMVSSSAQVCIRILEEAREH